MSSTDDLTCVVEQEPPLKPPASAKPSSKLSQAGEWLKKSRKNQALTGLGLLTLIAVPCIVGPSVAAANKAKQQKQAAALSDYGGEYEDDPNSPRTFNAAGGNSTGLRVPRRTRESRASLTRPETWTPFVKIKDGQFDEHCRPFYPVGFNAFELTMLAATNRKEDVDDVFRSAANMGMTAARTWAHSISPKWPFQTAPGMYDEDGLKALDYVIHSASKHGIKLILSFIDNWKYYNGVDQFVDWCIPERRMPLPAESASETPDMTDDQKRYETERHALFFKEEACKQLYKDHVAAITGRVNSYNGLKYKNDPTILAWNLINEPRCETWIPQNSWCHEKVADWYKEMADFVRTKDANHLVTSGSEGFFGEGDPNVSKNPQPWAAQTGQNFVTDNKHMDFAVLHAWPDNWQIPDERQGDFLRSWLDSHLTVSESIGKPLLFEEFGKKLQINPADSDVSTLRDPVYEASYNAVEQAIEANRPLLGSLYWKWAVPNADKGPYDVEKEHSTMGVIKRHAGLMHKLVNAIPPRPSCVYPAKANKPIGAWFAASPKAKSGECINAPDVSLAFYMLYGAKGNRSATASELGLSPNAVTYARALRKGRVSVYPTKRECCMPALGAYKRGCTGSE